MSALTTGGTLALAPVVPLTLTAHTRGTGTPPSYRPAPDRSGLWLRNAAAGLCILAAAAAAVSFTAQYRMAETARHLPAIAALEAAIPDAAALVFACLGIALALHGRRALRARALNLASVGTSVFMNAIAAEPGWHNLAIWALPPVAYALASDTLISVVRVRHQHLTDEAATPLAILGGLLLWLLRLALAPASTLAGFRAWVLAECPVAPGRRPAPAPHPRKATKTARFLDLVTERHGSLASGPAQPRRRDQRRPGPPARPEHRRRPHRPAQSRPGRPQRRPPMIIKLAILLAVLLIVAGFAAWAFLPARHLPGNRARHLRDPPAPAAAPRQRLRPPLQPVAALVPLRGPAPLRPDPPRPSLAVQPAGPARALGLPRPRPLPARPARSA